MVGEEGWRLLLGGLALSLEDLHDDLLLLNEESPNNLLADGLVAQDTSVGSEDLLVSEGVPGALAGPQGLDSLKLDPGHGALGHGGSLLQILEDELAAGSANQASPVRLRVVRQPSSVGDALNHLKNDNSFRTGTSLGQSRNLFEHRARAL